LPKFESNIENLLSILKQTDKYDNTFVHVACKNNNLDILKFFFASKLLDDHSKAELVFAKNNYEQTGFHISCFEGHYEVVKFFLTIEIFNQSALIQDVDETFNTCLHLAAMKGHHRIVR
jgi:ankyrin repeat protein